MNFIRETFWCASRNSAKRCHHLRWRWRRSTRRRRHPASPSNRPVPSELTIRATTWPITRTTSCRTASACWRSVANAINTSGASYIRASSAKVRFFYQRWPLLNLNLGIFLNKLNFTGDLRKNSIESLRILIPSPTSLALLKELQIILLYF